MRTVNSYRKSNDKKEKKNKRYEELYNKRKNEMSCLQKLFGSIDKNISRSSKI